MQICLSNLHFFLIFAADKSIIYNKIMDDYPADNYNS